MGLTWTTPVLLIAAYVLAGLAPLPKGRTLALLLPLLPALAASWSLGFQWPGGAVIALVFAVSMGGYHFQSTIENAAWWLIAQTSVIATITSLAFAVDARQSVPPEVLATAILLAGATITTEWGGAWVGRAIQPFADDLASAPPHEAKDGIVKRRGLPGGFPDGGKMIGRLERMLVFLFVIVGTPSAIGFLIAAKSIFRFGEIKDSASRKAAEYIIIGTLMSFGFALVTSYLTQFVLFVLMPDSPMDALFPNNG